MKINFNNKEIIEKEINLHDYMFNGFTYNYLNNKIIVSISGFEETGLNELIFNDVIGFRMNSCDFWGSSPHILCWECLNEDDSFIIKDLNKENENYKYSRLCYKTKYIQTVFVLSSGDKLDIACENIIIR